MYYIPPKRPKLAVIFIRTGSDLPPSYTADIQESVCRRYCESNFIPISHSVRVNCESDEALDVLRYLLRTLPKEVDTLFAVQFMFYSRRLDELGRLCVVFQCRPTWVYSLDLVQPICKMLFTVKPEDYQLADQRYMDLIK